MLFTRAHSVEWVITLEPNATRPLTSWEALMTTANAAGVVGCVLPNTIGDFDHSAPPIAWRGRGNSDGSIAVS